MGGRCEKAASSYLTLEDGALLGQCDVDHYRSHGPGGQKRNKTSSAVRLRHRPTGLMVTAVEDRSQHVNTVRALRRLREAIALHVRTPIDVETYARSERLLSCMTEDGRFHAGRRDQRYYPAVCEILDLLAACDARVRHTAARLGTSTATLVHFIQKDRKLWERVNQMRIEAGIKPLR